MRLRSLASRPARAPSPFSRQKVIADLFGQHRAAEQEALGLGAAFGHDPCQLLLGFNPCRHRRHAETLTDPDRRTDNRPANEIIGRAANEGLIDLDPVEWKAAQVPHRRISDATSSATRTPSPRSVFSISNAVPPASSITLSVISSSRRRGSRPLSARADMMAATRFGVRHWIADTLTETVRVRPACRLQAGGPHHPVSDRADDADIFRDRDE